jgi:hypothetical protein
MRAQWKGVILGGILVAIGFVLDPGTWATIVHAAAWSGQYVRQLPDSAFASVETAPDGSKVRHLPHHDADGKLDPPHLCSALGRLHQVKWIDPGHAEAARRHLQEHLASLGQNPCRQPARPTP